MALLAAGRFGEDEGLDLDALRGAAQALINKAAEEDEEDFFVEAGHDPDIPRDPGV